MQAKRAEANLSCSECGLISKSEAEIKKHMKDDHEDEDVRSREVCRHYQRGNCNRGNNCKFAHVGFQQQSTSKSTWNRNTAQ